MNSDICSNDFNLTILKFEMHLTPKTLHSIHMSTDFPNPWPPQCHFWTIFSAIQAIGVEGHPTTKYSLQYPWVDNWLMVIVPLYSGWVESCKVSSELVVYPGANVRP